MLLRCLALLCLTTLCAAPAPGQRCVDIASHVPQFSGDYISVRRYGGYPGGDLFASIDQEGRVTWLERKRQEITIKSAFAGPVAYRALRDKVELALEAFHRQYNFPVLASREEFVAYEGNMDLPVQCTSLTDGVDTDIEMRFDGKDRGYFCVPRQLDSLANSLFSEFSHFIFTRGADLCD